MSSAYPPYNGIPTKPCSRCGVPLPINDLRCNNCGYYNAPAPMQNNNGRQDNGQQANMPWGSTLPTTPASGQLIKQWRQIPSTPALQSGYGQTPAVPTTTPPSTPPAAFGSSPVPAFNGYPPPSTPPVNSGNYYGPAQQPMGYYNSSSSQQPLYAPPPTPAGFGGFQQGTMNIAPPPGNGQPPRAQRGPHMGVIIGTIVLLLIIVGGGIAGYSFLKASGQNTPAGAKPTASVANPTPTPKGQPLFIDAFKDNTQQWNLLSDQGQFSATIGNGSLVLEDDNNKLLWEMVPGGKTFSDFNLYVDAVLSKGEQNNGYGIYIRSALGQNNDLATYYRFEFYGDGTFAIFKGSVDGNGTLTSTRIVDYTQSPAIQKQGGVNHIEIAAKGSAITLLVNGQILKTINDSSYASGEVALFVSNLQGSRPIAQATFSHFAIYPPQS